MSQVPLEPDFEDQLAASLDLAKRLTWYDSEAVKECLLQDKQLHSMPEVALWRLHIGAMGNFFGILQCLRTKYSSIGALSLLRGVIEALTHIYYIFDETESLPRSMKGIAVESGILFESMNLDTKLVSSFDRDKRQSEINRNLTALVLANGGTTIPRRRDSGDVAMTVKKMEDRQLFPQGEFIRAATSSAVHMQATDHLLTPTPAEVTVTWADNKRIPWLYYSVMSFAAATKYVIQCSDLEATPQLLERSESSWAGLLSEPFIADNLERVRAEPTE